MVQIKAAVVAMTAVPTTIHVMRERVTVILMMTVLAIWFVDLITVTVKDIIPFVIMITALNIQIDIVQVKIGVAIAKVVPTTISVVRERVTVTLMKTVLET